MFEYYGLVKLAIEIGSDILPDASLPVTCISVILGSILSYFLYQFGLKASLNKNHLKYDINKEEVVEILKGNSDVSLQNIINQDQDSDINNE